ncbi:MAG: Cupin 2 conserved barrel domain protein [Acidimicrobiales bacterium]|nr:Cupin 2 conserved barrel domain protein [Acidimicrobiales bacterium]
MDAHAAVSDRDRWFVGTLLTIVADGRDTDGGLALMEQRARAGFSPPRHVHRREDTAMYVIDGELTVDLDGRQSQLGTGGFAWLPRDVPHTFRVDSDTATFLEIVTPAGFEQYHVDASDPASDRTLPPQASPDIARLVGAIGPYGAEIIGPPLDPA